METETAMAMATETGTETATGTGTAMATETATAMETETAMETAMETETAMATETGTAMATETATAMETELTKNLLAMLRRVAVPLASVTLLTACATGVSDNGTSQPCPSLVDYSAEFREQAALEIDQLSEDSAIATMLKHYAAMRDETRACARIQVGS